MEVAVQEGQQNGHVMQNVHRSRRRCFSRAAWAAPAEIDPKTILISSDVNRVMFHLRPTDEENGIDQRTPRICGKQVRSERPLGENPL